MSAALPDGVLPGSLSSPADGTPLARKGDSLLARDGARYRVEDGIADLLDPRFADAALRQELDAFLTLPVEDCCSFRSSFMREAATWAGVVGAWPGEAVCTAEIGGGEGHLARNFHALFPEGRHYVIDISMRHLRFAPPELVRVRADARRPCLAPTSVDLAAFWVSLHHFTADDAHAALAQAFRILRPGGILLVFEPSGAFFPRRLLMASPLKRLVYFDEAEKPIEPGPLHRRLVASGFSKAYAAGVNPPYNPAFLRKLRWGPFFLVVTEFFHRAERALRFLMGGRVPHALGRRPRWLSVGSYFFAMYKR